MNKQLFFLWFFALLLLACRTVDNNTLTLEATMPVVPSPEPATPTVTATHTPLPTATEAPTATFTPIPPTATAPLPGPTNTPLPIPPTPTTIPVLEPAIDLFQANVTATDPGTTIQLEWVTSNADNVSLYNLWPSGQLGEYWDVAASGVFTYTIPELARNNITFMLFAGDGAGEYEQATVTILLNCLDEWFFSPAPENSCPSLAPAPSAAAEQHFERGVMIWIAELERIYILYSDDQFSPKWDVFSDDWQEGDPVDDPSIVPPDGFYQPVRGFGIVWRDMPNVRDRLGWAIDQETSFNTFTQSTSLYKYNTFYIQALDGNVWVLEPERSAWHKLIVE